MRIALPVLLLAQLAGCGWFGGDMPPVNRMPNPELATPKAPAAPAEAGSVDASPLPAPLTTSAASDSIPSYGDTAASIAGDIVTVTVSDPLPVKEARLIAPDGSIVTASTIDGERLMTHEDNGLRPRIGVGVSGGSSGGVSTGIGIGFPLFPTGESKTYSVTRSRITFRLADPADYRQNWQRYAIAVDLDDGVNRRSFQMLPPAPN